MSLLTLPLKDKVKRYKMDLVIVHSTKHSRFGRSMIYKMQITLFFPNHAET